MISPFRVWTIGLNTVREAIRNKLLYTLLFFAIVMIGTGVIVGSISYVEGSRILQDVGLGSIRLFSTGIAIFVGVGLIHGEVHRRTIYTILSKPVSRAEFLVGKFVGLVMTIWMQLAIMSVAFVAVSLASGAPIDLGHFSALALIGVELAIIVAVATLFSSFTTPMLASFFTLGIYMMGHLTRDLLHIGGQAESESVKTLSWLVYEILPDLEMFNLSIQAVHQLPIATTEVVFPVLYGVGYITALLFAATAIFERRDFK
ncbi:MAG: ABC-type transport system involved in multi-copper enzyme maturation permease subunit [Myxococcota bacterium]|jgi:ABC-type transport system involved in multi-copper enzyme maturation permease subunit